MRSCTNRAVRSSMHLLLSDMSGCVALRCAVLHRLFVRFCVWLVFWGSKFDRTFPVCVSVFQSLCVCVLSGCAVPHCCLVRAPCTGKGKVRRVQRSVTQICLWAPSSTRRGVSLQKHVTHHQHRQTVARSYVGRARVALPCRTNGSSIVVHPPPQ